MPRKKYNSKWFKTEKKAHIKELRIFCLPYAGGGASVFRNWSDYLPDFIDICPIQLPGREDRILESAIKDMDELVDILKKEIHDYLDLPYIIFGHSLGARIGFELTRSLINEYGIKPLQLIVAGSRAPEIPEPNPLHHLPDDKFIKELKRFSGTPEEVLDNKDLMGIFIPSLRADFSIDETWIFLEDEPLEIPITAFYGTDDPEASKKEISGWENHTSSDFELIPVKGEHFFINDEQDSFLKLLSDNIKNSITISTL